MRTSRSYDKPNENNHDKSMMIMMNLWLSKEEGPREYAVYYQKEIYAMN